MRFYYRLLVTPTVQSNSLHRPYISMFSIQFQHVINLSLHLVSSEFSLSCKIIILALFFPVMFYFCFTLSYMLSTFQVLTHTCATSSRDVGSGSQHPDHA